MAEFVIYVTVFDNLRYIAGNVREQQRVSSRCVTTAVKTFTSTFSTCETVQLPQKKRLRNDRCTRASHCRSDNTESPERKRYQSTTTLCGSSADTQTQACEKAMVLKPSELDTTPVGGSKLQLRARNPFGQPLNIHALEATLL